ncbi:MAG: LytR C-terminal domain-containing protein [Acidimicrobiia bacterium]|nr:LytR C-terminal domain-containing protein [Acidimicrobiia bacterium]
MCRRYLALTLTSLLAVAACGGGDDSGDSSDGTTASSDTAVATVATTAAPTSSTATTSTTEAPVTEGATVIVANSSIAGGAAGRMTEELIAVGYTTGEPTNGTDRLEDSIVHYTDAEGAQEVAESLGLVLGDVEVAVMPDPIPTEAGTIAGQVLLLLGNKQADRTLDELSGEAVIETAGSIIVVANDSGINGAAGEMATTLENAGFAVGEPTNGTEARTESIVYYTDDEDAQADAELLAEEMGGLEVEPMPDPIPTESGELDGDVLLLLGTNQAGKSLIELNP